MSTNAIALDNFLRIVEANKENSHCVLLGAGASRNSGVPTAEECIDEWKRKIYISNNLEKVNRETLKSLTSEDVQKWLDEQGKYLPSGHSNEYTFYVEEAYKDEDSRRAYFEKLFRDKSPSPGYLILCQLIKVGLFKYIFTTNFDDLITKAAVHAGVVALEVNLDATKNIHAKINNLNFIKIALHGDYKFSSLKNTARELDSQLEEELIRALKHYLITNDLIVVGYSGRDKSLMEALESAYKENGSGRLYWISYSDEVLPEVEKLVCAINTSKDRRAYHVKSGQLDFDQVLGKLAKNCFIDNEEIMDFLESINTSNTNPNEELQVANYQEQLALVTSIETSSTSKSKAKELQSIKLEIASEIEKTLRDLVFGFLIGGWNENNPNDKELIERVVKKDYQTWIESIREVYETPYSPISLKNGVWTASNKLELLEFLSGKIYDNHLVSLENIAISVLGEINPEFDLPQEERYAAALYDKQLSYSESIREGIAESIVLIGIGKDKLINCSTNSRNFIAVKIVRKLFLDADCKLWGSLNNLIPILAETAPEEFLNCVEHTLRRTDKPFDALFSQESNGSGGRIYTTGLLCALESLAWSESHLSRALLILAELASIDPGGNWANRPINSLKTILLPWIPQTLANKDKRVNAIKPVIRYFPDIAWKVILAMLPSQHSTSSGTHKPKWRDPISDDYKQVVTNQGYWEEVNEYANLALDMAERDVSKLIELAKEFDHLPEPIFDRFNTLLSSERVKNLPEKEKSDIWNNLVDFTQKHRRFSDAAWALPNEALIKIEAVALDLAPADITLKHERLFGNNDWDLYDDDEHNLQVRQEKLNVKRAKAVAEIYETGGMELIYRFIKQVKSPKSVGIALADFNEGELTAKIIPQHLNDEHSHLKQFAEGFTIGAFSKYDWDWVARLDIKNWKIEQKVELVLCLPFTAKTIKYVSEILNEKENLYWSKAWINAYNTDVNLLWVVDKLREVKRAHTAIDILYLRYQKDGELDIQRSIKALLAINASVDQANQISSYEITELIKALQEDPKTPEDDLFKVEWLYVRLLDNLRGNRPVCLEKRLSTDPEFLAELMRLLYKGRDDVEVIEPDEEKANMATNAWRLLQNWKLPPGLKDGVFNADDFINWVNAVKTQANADKRHKVTMQEIGKVFYYYPESDNGLWLPKEVAEVIDGPDAGDIRTGYALEIYNSRGVHWVDPEAKEEKRLVEKWLVRAVIAEDAGYPRFGAKLREVSESYKHDAQRVIDEHSTSNDD